MIELKKEFTKGGTHFKQLFKDERIAVYELSSVCADNGKVNVWYEVFRRLVMQSDIYHNDEYEKYPNDESFGKWAWSCSNIKSVEKVLKKHFKDVEPIKMLRICVTSLARNDLNLQGGQLSR